MKELVGAIRIAVEEALLGERQKEKTDSSEVDVTEQLMGLVAMGIYKNPTINNENVRMGLQSEFRTPTKFVSENGKHVQFFRGRNNNSHHYRNG